MASTASTTTRTTEEKKMEKKVVEKNSEGSGTKDLHVKLPRNLIERLKNMSWGERSFSQYLNYNEEQIQQICRTQFDFDETLSHLLSEEIVWDDDVWGLQQITEIPEPHAKKPKHN